MKQLLPFGPLALLLLLTIGGGACTSKPFGGGNDGNACIYGGNAYAGGASFKASDGCNTCNCEAGRVSCTLVACGAGGSPANGGEAGTADAGSADAGATCSFDANYVYGFVGGIEPFTDLVTLTPPDSYTLVRTPVPGNTLSGSSGSCAPALPMCGDGNAIDVSDVMSDIADPAVQLLLSLTTTQTIMLGVRITPDDSLFSFQISGTAGFQVGASCWDGLSNCTAIPPSVAKLRADLIALDKQQRMDPLCAGPLSTGS